MRTLILIAFAALAFPAAAAAGGWATAGLGPPTDGTGPGDTWRAEITIKQHGVTPLTGVHPSVTITGPETATFPAKPTGKPGVYVANVVFPTAGTYRYAVDDGFGGRHTFAPVEIGAPATGGSGFPGWAIAPIVLGGAALAGLAALLLRRRVPRPAPATH
jgi:hypothetical protein